jgi:hypothetical protein
MENQTENSLILVSSCWIFNSSFKISNFLSTQIQRLPFRWSSQVSPFWFLISPKRMARPSPNSGTHSPNWWP